MINATAVRPVQQRTFAWIASSVVSVLILCLSLIFSGCTAPEKTALQVSYAAQGFLAQAQQNHLEECKAAPTKPFPCAMLTQAIGAQNMLIDVAETYCGWPVGYMPPPGTPVAPCAANKDVLARLQAATNNLSQIIKNYKIASGGKP